MFTLKRQAFKSVTVRPREPSLHEHVTPKAQTNQPWSRRAAEAAGTGSRCPELRGVGMAGSGGSGREGGA